MSRKLLPAELVEIIARNEGITKKKSEAFMRAFFEVVEEGLRTDSFVKIKGFGTFKLVNVSERESVNINTGERFQISGHTKVSFLPDPAFKDLINRPFSHFETMQIPDSTTQEELDAINEAPTEAPEEPTEVVDEVETAEDTQTLNEVADTPQSDEAKATPSPVEEDMEDDTAEESPVQHEEVKTSPTEESPIEEVESEVSQTQEVILEYPKAQEITPKVEAPLTPQQSIDKEPSTIDESPLTQPTSSTPTDSTETEMNATDNNSKTGKSRTLLWVTLWILSLIIAYLAGYHRIIPLDADFHNEEPIEASAITAPVDTLQATTDTLVATTDTLTIVTPINSLPAGADTLSVIRGIDKVTAEKLAEGKPQVEVGSFLIIGTYRKHTMRPGDTLFKLARSVYGHKDYVKYIILYNQFPDPNNVHIGTEILLPQLVEKEECAG